MKTLLTALACFLFLNGYSQTFAPPGAKWWYGTREAFSPNYSFATIAYQKDTIIKNKLCKKLIADRVICEPGSGRVVFAYEDSARLYIYDSRIDSFNIHYNFNANVGDEWIIRYDTTLMIRRIDSFYTDTINSVVFPIMEVSDVLIVYNSYQNEYDTLDLLGATIYRYIGGQQYFYYYFYTEFPLGYCDATHVDELRCYYDDSLGLYHRSYRDCDAVGIPNPIFERHITLYPNPTTDKVYINCSNCANKNYSINLNTISGNQVWIKPFITNNISISSLPSGIYLLTITDSDGNFSTKKLVKL